MPGRFPRCAAAAILYLMKLLTKIFAGFFVIFLLLVSVDLINFRLSEEVLANSQAVTRSQTVVRGSAALQRYIVDTETGLRGYLLTGNAEFLEPYRVARQQLPALFQDLTARVNHSPAQLQHLKQIQNIHARWVHTFAEVLIAQKQTQTQTRPDLNHTGIFTLQNGTDMINAKGKVLTDSMRALFQNFDAREFRVRAAHETRLRQSINRTRQWSVFLTVASVLSGLGGAYYLARLMTRRITNMVHLAEKISQGDYKTQIQDTARDELSKLAASLNAMARKIDHTINELENKNKELDQFAYVVSHDLKAPLRGIENASRWVEEDMGQELPPHVQEYLRLMRIRVHRMENLINGILALARIGRTKISAERVDVRKLLAEITDMLHPPAGFRVKLPPELPVLYTPRIYLQQVFTNLIGNAIKYHDKETGLITVNARETPNFYQFTVTDDGPGIDPQYHERIFVIFQTLQERDAVESTGVGLAIVKKIIHQQGGTITVASGLGRGATFVFTWPKTPFPAEAALAAARS